MMVSGEVFDVADAAVYLKLSEYTVRQKAREGAIPAAKVGRAWRFRKADLEAWLSAGGTLREEEIDAALVAEVHALAKSKRQRWIPMDEVEAEYTQ